MCNGYVDKFCRRILLLCQLQVRAGFSANNWMGGYFEADRLMASLPRAAAMVCEGWVFNFGPDIDKKSLGPTEVRTRAS